MQIFQPILIIIVSLMITTTTANAQSVNASELSLEWNHTVLSLAEAEDGFLTLKGVRTAAMAHLAMHDALASIDLHYTTYGEQLPSAHSSPIAAATQAAFTILLDQYPDSEDRLRSLTVSNHLSFSDRNRSSLSGY